MTPLEVISSLRKLVVVVWALTVISALGLADDDLAKKSIEELLQVPVTLQRGTTAFEGLPAAVTALTAEDIRRMGFATIPEALRLVPGMDVARIDGSSWAISSRGFNGRFANKLLVLIDGQSVYTPNFSGVFWDTIDLPVDILDRIEVIRGPGGTLFGPNAVNGIINIITKRAGVGGGVFVDGRVGDRELAKGSFVVDTGLGDGAALRVHGQTQSQGANRMFTGAPGNDGWDCNGIGLRFDWSGPSGDSLTLLAGGYRSHLDRHVVLPSFTPPFTEISFDHVDQAAWNLLGRYEVRAADTSVVAQVAYDRSNRTILHAREDRNTLDVDLSLDTRLAPGLAVQAGIGYRTTRDEIDGSFFHSYSPTSKTDDRFSGFLQGSWGLNPRNSLTVGAKVLHDEYAGWQLQPSVRVMHTPREHEHLWASLTRAVRTPSRADRTVALFADATVGPGGLPLFTEFRGAPDFGVESVVSLEAGYRRRFSESAFVDAAAYLNFYEGLRTFEPQDLEFRTDPAPHWVLPMQFANNGRATTVGAEVYFLWQATPAWRLALTASVKSWRYRVASDSGDFLSKHEHFETPRHQFSLQSLLALGNGWTLDAFLAYVDSLLSPTVDAYWRFDARLGYQLADGTVLEAGVRNAFRPAAIEFPLQVGAMSSQVPPTVYFGARRKF